jgi:RNA polymerase sigma-70 factor (ECF subfamily)
VRETETSSATDHELIARLRAGDEAAFVSAVREHGPAMLRVAQIYVPTRAVAEDVVQETWLAAFAGLERFEERASFRTWLFRILVNRARTRGLRERRTVPFSALDPDGPEAEVERERFQPEGHRWAGHWVEPPQSFSELPEQRLLSAEVRTRIAEAIAELHPRQREVITLRDVEGWSAEEVCEALGLSDGHQRVLLHRARAAVRKALEDYLLAPAVAS